MEKESDLQKARMNSVQISVPSVNLGTVSLRRHWYKYGAYLVCLLCFTLIVMYSNNKISLHFQYFEVTDLSDIGLMGPKFRLGQYRALKRLFKERHEVLEETCAKYSNPLRSESSVNKVEVDQARFYYLKNPDFMMCMIPKVASTSFSRFLLQAHQRMEGRGMENLGHAVSFAQSVTGETYKVIVVRHPLERLLSAYIYIFNDEVIADTSHSNCYSNLSRLLLHNYRENPGPEDLLSFPEFVRFIVNGTSEDLKGSWVPTEGRPDDFWIRDEMLHSHWMPYWKMCTPCRQETKPTAILKMGETLNDEANYVFQESGIFDFFKSRGLSQADLQLPWINPSKEGRADDLRRKYFSQLSKRAVQELYHKYRVDHELFGYSIEPYLSLAQ